MTDIVPAPNNVPILGIAFNYEKINGVVLGKVYLCRIDITAPV